MSAFAEARVTRTIALELQRRLTRQGITHRALSFATRIPLSTLQL